MMGSPLSGVVVSILLHNCVLGVCCPGAARPALCCPAAGEGPRGRQRRSAVKLTPVIIPPDWPCRTVGNGRGSGRTKGIFVDGSSGPTMLFWGFFFYWPESGFLVKNRRARVTNGCRRHFACPIQHLARVDENSIEDHKCEEFSSPNSAVKSDFRKTARITVSEHRSAICASSVFDAGVSTEYSCSASKTTQI